MLKKSPRIILTQSLTQGIICINYETIEKSETTKYLLLFLITQTIETKLRKTKLYFYYRILTLKANS